MSKRKLLSGPIVGAIVGLIVWLIIQAMFSTSAITVTVGSALFGLVVSVIFWLVPKPQEALMYLKAFWETWNLSPDDRLHQLELKSIVAEQRLNRASRYIYVHLYPLRLENLGNTPGKQHRIHAKLVILSCLADDIVIQRLRTHLRLIETDTGLDESIDIEFLDAGGRTLHKFTKQPFYQFHSFTNPQLTAIQHAYETNPTGVEVQFRLTIESSGMPQISIGGIQENELQNQS